MSVYFHEQESAHYRYGGSDSDILKVLAQRYIGANPQAGFVYRTFLKSGVLQNHEGLYELNLASRFPDVKPGQWAYGAALVWSDEERNLDLMLRCLGPVRFLFNGQQVYRSTVLDEVSPDAKVKLNVTFKKGWNTLFLKMKSTPAGFGCLIGADEAKVRILNVLAPFRERKGQAGWVFSKPVDADVFADEAALPDLLASEAGSGMDWLPVCRWSEDEQARPVLERLFGRQPGRAAYTWSRFSQQAAGPRLVHIAVESSGPVQLWVNDRELMKELGGGKCQVELMLAPGDYDLLMRTVCTDVPWQVAVSVAAGGESIKLYTPCQVHGAAGGEWFYAGPFHPNSVPSAKDLRRMDRVYRVDPAAEQPAAAADTGKLPEVTYWRLDLPEAWVRPYYENAMLSNKWTVGTMTNYARWDYPLGVTIYGLLQTGRFLNRPDVIRYAVEHVQACTDMYEYSMWDKEQYGFPSVNQQLVLIKMLDNCGSFGSAMLEAYKESGDEAFVAVAERIADFMLNRLERREDGAFYRTCPGEYSADTMWADDLYMSTPFLCRYSKLTGNAGALDEAAKQFLLFKKYLFMPEERIMSHVYDFKYGRATGIPWGRGNGWVLFSLTEVLEALPVSHRDRPALIDFFNELCGGYLALQTETGLWRQVLNRQDAYLEASCTAMFAYAFARGVRFGWLREPDRFAAASMAAWGGLTRLAIDRMGHVHGVCSGSRYAFTSDYYNDDLHTVTNDNHGIGIMMLAGTEVAKLKRHLSGLAE